jgi:hypothetical protein
VTSEAGLAAHFAVAAFAAVLLASRWRSRIALDARPAQRAKIGGRAVAFISRYLVRIAPQVGLDGIEQRRQMRLIAAVVAKGVRHDDLRLGDDGGLRIIALM